MEKHLNEVQIEDIRKLALDLRRSLGFGDDIPIANDIFSLLDRQDIFLVEYPVHSDKETGFDASLTCFVSSGKEMYFLGLNTSNPFDKQIFGIAHELYHYLTNTIDLCDTQIDEEKTLVEIKADRFAAELLLPLTSLRSIILSEFKTSSLENITNSRLLRFICRLQYEWWLPYRSIVKRLSEENFISDLQFNELYNIDERDDLGEYGRICYAMDRNLFDKLNTSTHKQGTSPRVLETVIANYEDRLIDVDSFINGMRLLDYLLKIFVKI